MQGLQLGVTPAEPRHGSDAEDRPLRVAAGHEHQVGSGQRLHVEGVDDLGRGLRGGEGQVALEQRADLGGAGVVDGDRELHVARSLHRSDERRVGAGHAGTRTDRPGPDAPPPRIGGGGRVG